MWKKKGVYWLKVRRCTRKETFRGLNWCLIDPNGLRVFSRLTLQTICFIPVQVLNWTRNSLPFFLRYSSAVRCDVSLPQKSTPDCQAARNAALAQNKKIWTLKYDPALHGFALLNMIPAELAAVVFKDPFTRYYTTAYTQTLQTNEKVLERYNNETFGQAINDFSEYLKISEFFQSVLEPLVGVDTIFNFLIVISYYFGNYN